MTEDDAKSKTCCGPFALVSAIIAASPKTKGAAPHGACIGSACMAWRWDEPWTGQTEEGHGGDIVIRLKRKAGEPRMGYCGLAGAVR